MRYCLYQAIACSPYGVLLSMLPVNSNLSQLGIQEACFDFGFLRVRLDDSTQRQSKKPVRAGARGTYDRGSGGIPTTEPPVGTLDIVDTSRYVINWRRFRPRSSAGKQEETSRKERKGMPRSSPQMPGLLAQCAFGLFSERGFDEVAIDDIAERAGVTKGSFYSHKPDPAILTSHQPAWGLLLRHS